MLGLMDIAGMLPADDSYPREVGFDILQGTFIYSTPTSVVTFHKGYEVFLPDTGNLVMYETMK